ncbi:MAG: polysaccharide biosynthesis/export family protein [Candidatus Eisenbacteria bacterium]
MKIGWRRGQIPRWSAPMLLLLLLASPARAVDYTLGAEDVLQISVWLHPELDRSVPIGPDGTLIFAPAGEIKAAGLSPKQLADRLGERLSTYLRQTTTVTVTVTQYLSRSVYVVGAVGRPGRFGFQTMPGLVDLISQAGGALTGADLSRVQVIRKEGEARRVLTADVSTALRDGIGTDLPVLRPGDTVVLNTREGGAYAGAPGDGVAVLGEVIKPGLYTVGSGLDVFMLMAQAGGFTGRANLKLVRIVTPSPGGSRVRTVNLKRAVERNGETPALIMPGDVVFVSPTSTSAAWTVFSQTLSISRDLLNVALAVDVLKR